MRFLPSNSFIWFVTIISLLFSIHLLTADEESSSFMSSQCMFNVHCRYNMQPNGNQINIWTVCWEMKEKIKTMHLVKKEQKTIISIVTHSCKHKTPNIQTAHNYIFFFILSFFFSFFFFLDCFGIICAFESFLLHRLFHFVSIRRKLICTKSDRKKKLNGRVIIVQYFEFDLRLFIWLKFVLFFLLLQYFSIFVFVYKCTFTNCHRSTVF